MIEKIKLKFGSSKNTQPLVVNAPPLTVFVGPNNSGKTKVLTEIEQYCSSPSPAVGRVILNEIDFAPFPFDITIESKRFILDPDPQEFQRMRPGYVVYGDRKRRSVLLEEEIAKILLHGNSNKTTYCNVYVSLSTMRIDGVNRMALIQPQQVSDLKKSPTSALQILFQDNSKREQVRTMIYNAFKKYFVIDPTHLGLLKIRFSDHSPKSESEEKGITGEAVEFHKQAQDIFETSDGIKAFTGIILTLIAEEPKITLIDEPEAFLHPTLAFILGKELSNIVQGTHRNLLVSTHSSNFLMGCIQSGTPLNIIRLTYSDNIATARILPSEKVLKLMRHPLLRSTGVLNGLFYKYVIVTEADSDRAFYQEINERLIASDPNRGIADCLFLNAQNKQTIHEIMRPLREMGIPAAAIADIDVINDKGTPWTKLLESAFVPAATINSTASLRASIHKKFQEKATNLKNGGIDNLDGTDLQSANDLFDQLDSYGIFTVRKGELESWLKYLSPNHSHSPSWLIEIFEKLGEDPLADTYVKPTSGDVWDFIGGIKSWLINATKKGMPD